MAYVESRKDTRKERKEQIDKAEGNCSLREAEGGGNSGARRRGGARREGEIAGMRRRERARREGESGGKGGRRKASRHCRLTPARDTGEAPLTTLDVIEMKHKNSCKF